MTERIELAIVVLVLIGIIVSSSTMYYATTIMSQLVSTTDDVTTLTDSVLNLTESIMDLTGTVATLGINVSDIMDRLTAVEESIVPAKEFFLRFSGWGAGATEIALYETMLTKFMEDNPEYYVKYEPVPTMYHENFCPCLGLASRRTSFT